MPETDSNELRRKSVMLVVIGGGAALLLISGLVPAPPDDWYGFFVGVFAAMAVLGLGALAFDAWRTRPRR